MIMSRPEAVKFLTSKGMMKAYSSGGRTYFAYGVNDVFLDHSATVTNVGKGEYHVSDFSHLRNQ